MNLMERVNHNAKIREAYFNELRRKDGKYNFVLVPLVNLGDTKISPIYHNTYDCKILSVMINGQVIRVNLNDLLILSLKPGQYHLRVELDIDCNLLWKTVHALDQKYPSVKHYNYKDRCRKTVEYLCQFTVNENDTAYVLLLAEIFASYEQSKNLLFMTKMRHNFKMHQTSLAHIESLYPKLYINPERQHKYETVEQCYIDEVYRLHGDELRKYKEVEKPIVAPTPKVEVKKPIEPVKTPIATTSTTGNKTVAPTKTISTFKYLSGDEYQGEMLNGIPHGKGTYYYNSGYNAGCKYVGSFVHGKKEGFATFYYKDKSYYIGYFKENVKHGKGTLYKTDGSKEDLEYNYDILVTKKEEVKPTSSSPNRSLTSLPKSEIKQNGLYYGEMVNGKNNGVGYKVYNDNFVNFALYKNDIIDGPFLELRNGELYIALGCSNLTHKFGMRIHKDHYQFSDNFPFDKLSKNIFVTPNKHKFTLNKGTRIYKSESSNFVGTTLMTYTECIGIKYNSNGKIHFGEFKTKKLNGYGLIYDDKTLYVGEFKDDVYEGYGMQVTNYKSSSYTVLIGKWSNGKFVG